MLKLYDPDHMIDRESPIHRDVHEDLESGAHLNLLRAMGHRIAPKHQESPSSTPLTVSLLMAWVAQRLRFTTGNRADAP